MLATIFIFLLGSLLGFALLRLARSPLVFEEQVLWGIPIGVMVLTWWVFVLACVLPFQSTAIILGTLSIVAGLIGVTVWKKLHVSVREDMAAMRERLRNKKEWIPWVVVLLPWLVYSCITIPRLMFFQDGALFAGWTNVWADWAVHLRDSTFFASTPGLSLENPLFAGTQSVYPPLSSFLSSILQRAGLGVDQSLVWPTFLFFATLPAILYTFARRITQSRKAGVFFVYIVLLAGGLGVVYLVRDLLEGHYFWNASVYAPQLYTDMRTNGGHTNSGIWFMNFIMSEIFPQRAFLAGMGMALYILYSVWNSLAESLRISGMEIKNLRPNLILAGFFAGMLPLIHTHSVLALGISLPLIVLAAVLGGAIVSRKKSLPASLFQREEPTSHFVKGGLRGISTSLKDLFSLAGCFIGPSIISGAIFVYLFFSAGGQGTNFFSRINWWIPEQTLPTNIFLFWLRNAGPLIVVAAAAAIALRKQKWVYPFFGAGLGIFILSNVFKFQPWIFDNLKVLTYWYILWALPAAALLAWLSRRRVIADGLLIMVLLTGSGAADVLSVAVSSHTGVELAPKEGIEFARLVKEITNQDSYAVIASATYHNDPVSMLSGRVSYMGYEGWLWTYGIEYAGRLSDLQQIYGGSPQGIALLRERGINYIVIGPQERAQFQANEAALIPLFPAVAEYGSYKLLRVNSVRGANQ